MEYRRVAEWHQESHGAGCDINWGTFVHLAIPGAGGHGTHHFAMQLERELLSPQLPAPILQGVGGSGWQKARAEAVAGNAQRR